MVGSSVQTVVKCNKIYYQLVEFKQILGILVVIAVRIIYFGRKTKLLILHPAVAILRTVFGTKNIIDMADSETGEWPLVLEVGKQMSRECDVTEPPTCLCRRCKIRLRMVISLGKVMT